MTPETYLLIGTLGGAFIGGAIAVVNNIINQRFEEKQRKRQIILNTAIESFRTAIQQAERNPRITGVIPLEYYILHMSKLANVILEESPDKEKLKKALEESQALIEECKDHFMNARIKVDE
jgi:hypothetical protein